jgi:hypothetical protein
MKKFSITALFLVSMNALVQADCFGGSNVLPEHPIEFIEFALLAGWEASQKTWDVGGNKKKMGRTSDNVCINLSIENKSNGYLDISMEQAVDAWMREYIGCEHGGRRLYPDGWEYS